MSEGEVFGEECREGWKWLGWEVSLIDGCRSVLYSLRSRWCFLVDCVGVFMI